jgi:hypothetical protein
MAHVDAVRLVEARAAQHSEPQWIACEVREHDGLDLYQLVTALEARITELAEAVKTRPDHKKLNRGLDTMRRVAQLLAPSGAEAELKDLAERIRVCVAKSDNYAATAGKHLREARERCRSIGLDFNKWCGQAKLGIKRSRIYQLMGPDPIATERHGTKHSKEPENVHSMDVPQLPNVEQPSLPQPEQSTELTLILQSTVVGIDATTGTSNPRQIPLDHPIVASAQQFSLRDLPFDEALVVVTDWFAELTVTQQNLVLETLEGANDADLSHDTLRSH